MSDDTPVWKLHEGKMVPPVSDDTPKPQASPREFWLPLAANKLGEIYVCDMVYDKPSGKAEIHVIEKSAYDALVKQLAQEQHDHNNTKTKLKLYEHFKKLLKDALEKQ